jgi:pimeloyl-ACP methyl ester carboxylesterase
VNALCTGAESSRPTVILVAGLPDPLSKFAHLQKALSEKGRVCSYDRPGEGTSPAPESTQSLGSTATLLDGVLKAEKVHGRVVVVGHSLGGLVAAQFTHQYPKRVAGLVLLDATAPSVGPALEALIPATSTGALAEIRGEATSFSSPSTNPEKLVYTGASIGSLGRTPLTVVQHGKPIYAPVPVYGTRMQEIWTEGQRQLAGLSTHSTMVTAAKSGHYIYLDQQALTIRLVDHATER